MEHYHRAETQEQPLQLADVPFERCRAGNVYWMRVKSGSRVAGVSRHAVAALGTHGSVLWTGVGAAASKALLCAELMKQSHGALHQLTHCCYHRVTEIWRPKHNAQLDEIRVTKQIPTLHVLLSTEPLTPQDDSYQSPGGSVIPFCSLRSSNTQTGSVVDTSSFATETPDPTSHVQQSRENVFKRRKKARKKSSTAVDA